MKLLLIMKIVLLLLKESLANKVNRMTFIKSLKSLEHLKLVHYVKKLLKTILQMFRILKYNI